MALLKPSTLSSGVELEYFRIDSFAYDRVERRVQIQVSGYLTAEHAANGAQPACNAGTVTLEADEADTFLAAVHDLVGPLAYQAVKGTPEFADSQDA